MVISIQFLSNPIAIKWIYESLYDMWVVLISRSQIVPDFVAATESGDI